MRIHDTRRLRCRARSATSGDRFRSAQKQRRNVKLHLIHQLFVERFAEQPHPAFDEHAGDLPATEVAQDGPERLTAIDEGAVAVGVGSALLDTKAIAAKQFDVIEANARRMVANVAASRSR